MLIWSSLSLFGLLIAHRTLIECESLHIFSNHRVIQIRLFSFLTVTALNFLMKDLIAMLIGLNIVIFLSPWWAPLFIEKHRESTLKNQFIPIVDGIIMSMKSGKGFRPALLQTIDRNVPSIQHVLREFLSAIQYQKEIRTLSRDPKILFFFQELAQVDQTSHKPVDKLKALRRRLFIEKNFRQKSRQALLQVRFQSWIISGMYLLVLGYVQHDFGLQKHLGLVLTSGLLFSTGLIVIQKMGRNYQWKI